jgi:sugar phosphate isomerase/epimerase
MFRFRYAVFHPPEKNMTGDTLDFLLHNLRQIPIPLVVENLRSWQKDRFGEFYKRLKDDLGQQLTGICLDIPHAVLSGMDWTDFYRTFRDDVKVIHLSDTDGREDSHMPFGMGGILQLDMILSQLSDFGFNGFFNFEIKPPTLGDLQPLFESYKLAVTILKNEASIHGRRSHIIGMFGRCLNKCL